MHETEPSAAINRSWLCHRLVVSATSSDSPEPPLDHYSTEKRKRLSQQHIPGECLAQNFSVLQCHCAWLVSASHLLISV